MNFITQLYREQNLLTVCLPTYFKLNSKTFLNYCFFPQEFDILEDQQRLTVAVTRAKHKLIIVGDINTLDRFTPFKKLIGAFISHDRIYDLKDGEDDFCFDDLIKLLL